MITGLHQGNRTSLSTHTRVGLVSELRSRACVGLVPLRIFSAAASRAASSGVPFKSHALGYKSQRELQMESSMGVEVRFAYTQTVSYVEGDLSMRRCPLQDVTLSELLK